MSKSKYPGWFDKNANELADFLAALSALVLGGILFILIYGTYWFVFERSWIVPYGYNVLFGVLALLLPVLFGLIKYFSSKDLRYIRYAKDEKEKNMNYVVSSWSISTLKFAGVPDDITSCLSKAVNISEKSSSEVEKIFDTSDEMIGILEEKLGSTRLEEYREVILKYTGREIGHVKDKKHPSPDSNDIGKNSLTGLELTTES
jgi:hypothetical protein